MAEIIPRPLDKAVESLNSKLANLQFKVIDCTSPSTIDTDEKVADYPTGFNNANCMIIGHASAFGANNSWYTNYPDNKIFGNNQGIQMKVTISGFVGKSTKILLAKYA